MSSHEYEYLSKNTQALIDRWLAHPRPDAWLRIIMNVGCSPEFTRKRGITNKESIIAAEYCLEKYTFKSK